MRPPPTLLIALLALASCGGGSPKSSTSDSTAPPSGTITVFAASSLTDAFGRVGDELTSRYPGTRVTFNFGSSSTLATQDRKSVV